jgi:murein L,D-transpeptidase YafK
MYNKLFISFLFGCLLLAQELLAQPPAAKGGGNAYGFLNYQKSFSRPNDAILRKEDTLQKQFAIQKLIWPAKYIYIRSFKYDSQLEVWVKNEVKEPFKLFKTYKVCALAGSLGPKRMEGDYQVPEGFYQINVFNPTSNYHLSLGLNYPNLSDKVLSDTERPGGDIYIHGSCVTVGCIPIRDEQIEELYILAAHAKDQGQDFIPVHIFPVRFNVEKSVKFLSNLTKDDGNLKKFAERLEEAFDYFEKYHQLPVVMVDDKGGYLVNEAPPKKIKVIPEEKPIIKKPPMVHRTRKVDNIPNAVHQWPSYPGGNNAFADYLGKVGNEMVSYLPVGIKKAFVQVEFVVDVDGIVVNFKVIKGNGSLDQEFIDELILRLEKMEKWTPALLNEKPVAKKMIQTVTIEAR